MAVVAFFSCARAQELTAYDQVEYQNELKYSPRSSVRISSQGFSLHLPYHKADRLFTGSKLWFAAADAGPLFGVVQAYLRLRDHVHGTDGPMWINEEGSVPTRRWFVDLLKSTCGQEYTGHSFRAGGATWYSERGAKDSTIKKLGRWSSDAWEEYVRMQPEIAIASRHRDATSSSLTAHLPFFDLSQLEFALPAI